MVDSRKGLSSATRSGVVVAFDGVGRVFFTLEAKVAGFPAVRGVLNAFGEVALSGVSAFNLVAGFDRGVGVPRFVDGDARDSGVRFNRAEASFGRSGVPCPGLRFFGDSISTTILFRGVHD